MESAAASAAVRRALAPNADVQERIKMELNESFGTDDIEAP